MGCLLKAANCWSFCCQLPLVKSPCYCFRWKNWSNGIFKLSMFLEFPLLYFFRYVSRYNMLTKSPKLYCWEKKYELSWMRWGYGFGVLTHGFVGCPFGFIELDTIKSVWFIFIFVLEELSFEPVWLYCGTQPYYIFISICIY